MSLKRSYDPLRLLSVLLALGACASSTPTRLPRWTDPDTRDVPKPGVIEEYRDWDFANSTVFYTVSTLLDENETFRPGEWVTSYPNAAFIWRTDRDGYWGAKIVVALSDEDIAAVVRTGRLSNPEAEAELTRLLIERRDMIGRYWFGRVNPLDRFRVEDGSLVFDDLAAVGGLERATESRYAFTLRDDGGRPVKGGELLEGATRVSLQGLKGNGYYACDLRTRRGQDSRWSDRTRVRFYLADDGSGPIVAIERQD